MPLWGWILAGLAVWWMLKGGGKGGCCGGKVSKGPDQPAGMDDPDMDEPYPEE